MLIQLVAFLGLTCLSLVKGDGPASCISPFLPAEGTSDMCYCPVPSGENGLQYCSGLNNSVSSPNPIMFFTQFNVCYYSTATGGGGTLPEGCCTGGLPGGRK